MDNEKVIRTSTKLSKTAAKAFPGLDEARLREAFAKAIAEQFVEIEILENLFEDDELI